MWVPQLEKLAVQPREDNGVPARRPVEVDDVRYAVGARHSRHVGSVQVRGVDIATVQGAVRDDGNSGAVRMPSPALERPPNPGVGTCVGSEPSELTT